MILDHFPKPGNDRAVRGVGLDLGRIHQQLLAPDQSGLITQLNHVLEEAAEDRQSQSLPNTGQTRVIGQRLIVPAGTA